jgi:hypothetical protein
MDPTNPLLRSVSEQAARAADEEDREEGKQLHRLHRPILDTRLLRYG